MNGNRASARKLAVAAWIAAFVTLLAACGGSSNKDQIVRIVKDYGAHPAKLCTMYADAFLIKAQFRTRALCLAAARSRGAADPRVKVDSVSFSRQGKLARVVRTSGTNPGAGTKSTVYLLRTRTGWEVDSVLPGIQ
jgi:hypothetical protein